MDSRKLPIYHTIIISPTESYIVDYANTKNGIFKVWKKINPKSELIEESYLNYEENPMFILEVSSKPIKTNVVEKKISNYQQFIKEKKIQYELEYPNMTKKERYNLILAEWKKNKD